MSLRLAVVTAFVLASCTSRDQSLPADSTRAVSTSSARRVVEAYIDAWNRHDSTAIDTLIAAKGLTRTYHRASSRRGLPAFTP